MPISHREYKRNGYQVSEVRIEAGGEIYTDPGQRSGGDRAVIALLLLVSVACGAFAVNRHYDGKPFDQVEEWLDEETSQEGVDEPCPRRAVLLRSGFEITIDQEGEDRDGTLYNQDGDIVPKPEAAGQGPVYVKLADNVIEVQYTPETC